MSRVGLVAILLTVTAGAQPTVRREGGVWTLRDQGTTPGKPAVKVIAPAKIRVTPSSGGQIRYSWIARLRANSEAEAKAALSRLAVQTKPGPDYCVLQVAGAMDALPGELLIEIPAGTTKLYLHSTNGAVSVDGLKAEVQAVTTAGAVEMDRVHGSVVARTGGGAMTFGNIEGALRALSGGGTIRAGRVAAEAVLETAGGDIFVGEIGGTLRLSTAGNIHVGRAGRSVSAHTTGGMIEVESAGGIVTAESMSGGITVGSAPGARCESADGPIRLDNMSGAVRASTASGNLTVTFVAVKLTETSFLATGRGDVTVFVPSNLAVTVKALNESTGRTMRFGSEFPEVQPRIAETSAVRPLAVEGSINGGGPLLMLSTASGAIQIRRRK